jgi:putative membrane protein insertion efficiency factor
MFSKFLLFLIKTYKILISPWLGNCCRFHPSCSSYAIDALKEYGPIKGSFFAIWRILRCNPFSAGGIDYIKEKKSSDSGG